MNRGLEYKTGETMRKTLRDPGLSMIGSGANPGRRPIFGAASGKD